MSKLPEEFADLERFADWCLPTEEEPNRQPNPTVRATVSPAVRRHRKRSR